MTTDMCTYGHRTGMCIYSHKLRATEILAIYSHKLLRATRDNCDCSRTVIVTRNGVLTWDVASDNQHRNGCGPLSVYLTWAAQPRGSG